MSSSTLQQDAGEENIDAWMKSGDTCWRSIHKKKTNTRLDGLVRHGIRSYISKPKGKNTIYEKKSIAIVLSREEGDDN